MIDYFKTYLIALLTFLTIDLLWLGIIAKSFYRNQLGFIMKDNFNWPAALIFYLFFIGGLLFFVISKAISLGSWQYALLVGMLFGFLTYATYDLTNLATLKDWPVLLTVVDIIWGTLLCGVTSLLTYLAANSMNYLH